MSQTTQNSIFPSQYENGCVESWEWVHGNMGMGVWKHGNEYTEIRGMGYGNMGMGV